MKRIPFVLVLGLILWEFSLPYTSSAQTILSPQEYIDNVLKANKELQHSIVGAMAVDENGEVIARCNPETRLSTASTMKTISTGLGLLTLGPDYRFETSVAYTGSITVDGTLKGDIYIIGGGDPTLGSKDDIAYPIDSIFAIWTDAVKQQGIRRIDGRIIGDSRYFEKEMIPGTWEWGDLGYYYGSGTSGLNFQENLSSFEISPGSTEGSSPRIRPIAPYSPEMTYLNESTTKSGSRENIEYLVSDIYPIGKFTGTYGITRGRDTIDFSNKYPEITCACAFSEYLTDQGIQSDGYSDEASAPYDFLSTIATTYSPELKDIAYVTNHISNNFFAETIFKSLSKVDSTSSKGSYDEARLKAYFLLDSLGLDMQGYDQIDGSGLTARNFVSPHFFCDYFSAMEKSAVFPEFLASFPQPGGKGTLKSVLSKENYQTKRKVHAKSGSITGVRCYAGYVEHNGGYIKFAIQFNNYTCPTSRIQPLIEGFIATLAHYE